MTALRHRAGNEFTPTHQRKQSPVFGSAAERIHSAVVILKEKTPCTKERVPPKRLCCLHVTRERYSDWRHRAAGPTRASCCLDRCVGVIAWLMAWIVQRKIGAWNVFTQGNRCHSDSRRRGCFCQSVKAMSSMPIDRVCRFRMYDTLGERSGV